VSVRKLRFIAVLSNRAFSIESLFPAPKSTPAAKRRLAYASSPVRAGFGKKL